MLTPEVFSFLCKLKKNNNRKWFAKNKNQFQTINEQIIQFADLLIHEMNKHDKIETASGKKAVFRIYRDVRFSKDKSPFKTNLGIHLARATKLRRGGYYLNIEPGNCFIGGGFWSPSPEDLKHIRAQIAQDPKPLRKILNSKAFIENFGTLQGEKLAGVPRGFDKNHPAADILAYKQFLVSQSIDEKTLCSRNGIKEVVRVFNAMRPFFNYMSEILTTNLNGEELFEN